MKFCKPLSRWVYSFIVVASPLVLSLPISCGTNNAAKDDPLGGDNGGGGDTDEGGSGGESPLGGESGGADADGGTAGGGGGAAGGGGGAAGGQTSSAGGIDGSGTTTGGKGGAAGSPPTSAPVRIQPLGDSITQGKRHPDEASYRRPLWKKLKAAGYAVDFVGSTNQQLDGPHYYDDYDPDHEGHYGWKITEVLPKLDGWLKGYKPDVSLIHLGTNDQGSRNPEQMIANIGIIIDKLRVKNPQIVIILAKLIEPRDVGRQFGDMLPGLASSKGTAASPIIVIDQDEGFSAADTRDGLHPNPQGQEKMATKWFDALVKILPRPQPGA